jgi:hypothetical protein
MFASLLPEDAVLTEDVTFGPVAIALMMSRILDTSREDTLKYGPDSSGSFMAEAPRQQKEGNEAHSNKIRSDIYRVTWLMRFCPMTALSSTAESSSS